MKLIFTILALVLFISIQAQDTTRIVGTITAVHDGDSYTFLRQDGTKEKIRLAWVDCNEIYSPPYVMKAQPFGVQTGNYVRSILSGKKVIIDSVAVDQNDNLLALVYVPITDTSLINLSVFLVNNGYAWVVKEYCSPPLYKSLHQMQDVARDSKLGMWGLPGRKLLPSTWRKRYGKNITSIFKPVYYG